MFFLNLSVMRPTEKLDLWADFANDFPEWSDGTIVSAVITLESIARDAGATEDTSESGNVVGSATVEVSEISGRATRVVQRIETPVAGNQYLITFTATTDTGQILLAEHRFWCRAAA